MKGFSNGLKWITAAALIVSMSAAPAFAAKTTPATDKNTNVPAVPRAIPDLIPYHKFDPPKSNLFDLKKVTISGDIRVRPEYRNNIRFGLSGTATTSARAANPGDFFVQQWVRLGINYAISPDVDFFFQPQYAKNWASQAADPNAAAPGIFVRQGFMLIRNFGIKNLTAKVGRQLVVWGNHRLFGHFDWNNVGWAFDGATLNYQLSKTITIQSGWLRVLEGDCAAATGGGCGANVTKASADADIIFLRAPMKIAGIVIEPAWIWHSGGTGGPGATTSTAGARPADQSRHTVGARVTTKRSLSRVMVDGTFEGYYQFGDINPAAGAGLGIGRSQDISAYALHFDAGVTLPVPMQPRIGGEFNIASGDGNNTNGCAGGAAAACTGTSTTFDQLFPTNHIHFGYMDRMAWKNMVHFAGSLQLRPTKASHLDIAFHKFYMQQTGDNWYGANQAIFIASTAGNTEDDLGSEIDVVYTLFFTEGNHVGWQIGGGAFFPGDFVDSNSSIAGQTLTDAGAETWGYTQLWINF